MTAPYRENLAFTDKAIQRAQHGVLGDPFVDALTHYLMAHDRILWDDTRALFWVKPAHGPAQVAVWMMDVAAKFEPIKEATNETR